MKWTPADMIRTPRGKRMTPGRYLTFALMRSAKTGGGGPSCREGHFDCAGWDGGPCSNALAAKYGLAEYDDTEPTS